MALVIEDKELHQLPITVDPETVSGTPVFNAAVCNSHHSVEEAALHPPVGSQCKSSLNGGCASGFCA